MGIPNRPITQAPKHPIAQSPNRQLPLCHFAELLYSGDWSLFREDCIAVLAVSLYAICVTCLIVWLQVIA